MQWAIFGYDVNGNIECVRTGHGFRFDINEVFNELASNPRVDHVRCQSQTS